MPSAPLRRILTTFGVVTLACVARPAAAVDDLTPLSDEFGTPTTLARWQRVQAVEQWNIEPLEVWDIAVSRPGRMTMMPFTVTWFQDYIGPMAFQPVGGDFVITSQVTSTGRDGHSVPLASYSLGGLMIRTPRNVTPATWTSGGENYVFLSIGRGVSAPPTFQFEVKTTVTGTSTLILSPSPDSSATLQIARIGGAVITLRRSPGGPWFVHRRYPRADFPDTLQVGLVAYTDWNKVQFFQPLVHNGTVLDPPLPVGVTDPHPEVPFMPDLLTTFEYARYARPVVPPELAGHDLTNAADVSDAQLLSFLGDNANVETPVAVGPGGPRTSVTLTVAPNPCFANDRAAILISGGRPRSVTIFDARGHRVRSMGIPTTGGVDGGRASWDLSDERGRRVAPGIYFATTRIGNHIETTRVAVLR